MPPAVGNSWHLEGLPPCFQGVCGHVQAWIFMKHGLSPRKDLCQVIVLNMQQRPLTWCTTWRDVFWSYDIVWLWVFTGLYLLMNFERLSALSKHSGGLLQKGGSPRSRAWTTLFKVKKSLKQSQVSLWHDIQRQSCSSPNSKWRNVFLMQISHFGSGATMAM